MARETGCDKHVLQRNFENDAVENASREDVGWFAYLTLEES